MIPIKNHIDLPFHKTLEDKPLLCSRDVNGHCELAMANGREVTMLDGMGDKWLKTMNFTVEFNIIKLTYYRIRSRSPNLRENTKRMGEEDEEEEEEERLFDEYLIVCGDKVIVFIDLDTYLMIHYAIPFKVRKVHATIHGLLVERDVLMDRSKCSNVFGMYSLVNPFTELLPVIYSSERSTEWKFCWQKIGEDCVIVGAEKNYVVTFNETTKRHSIYRIRETDEEEVRKAVRHYEDSRLNTFQSFNNSLYQSPHTNSLFTPPQNVFRNSDVGFQNIRSPALQALSDAVDNGLEYQTTSSSFAQALSGAIGSTSDETATTYDYQNQHAHFPLSHSTPHNHNVAATANFGPTPVTTTDSISTSPWVKSPMVRGVPSTPVPKAPATLERNIHTRTLAKRGMQLTPHTGAATSTTTGTTVTTTATTSNTIGFTSGHSFRTPILHRGRRDELDNSKAETVREFERMIRNHAGNATKITLVSNKDMGEIERDPENDLLLAKISLEHVFTESTISGGHMAKKMFLSTHLERLYLNYLVNAELRVVRIFKRRDGKTSQKMNYETLPCKDASAVQKGGLTLLFDGASLSLYGGTSKIAVVCLNSACTISSETRLHPCYANSSLLVTNTTVTRIFFPPKYNSGTVKWLMMGVLEKLPEELRYEMDLEWYSGFEPPEKMADESQPFMAISVQNTLLYLFNQVGYSFGSPKENECGDESDTAIKQKRPKLTKSEVTRLIDECLGESGNSLVKKNTSGVVLPTTCKRDVKHRNAPHVRTVFYALHSVLQDWLLHITLTDDIVLPLFSKFMAFMASNIGEPSYVEYYQTVLLCEPVKRTDTARFPPGQPQDPFSIFDFLSDILTRRWINPTTLNLLSCLSLRVFIVFATSMGLLFEKSAARLTMGSFWWKRLWVSVPKAKTILKALGMRTHGDSHRASRMIRALDFTAHEIRNLPIGVRMHFMKTRADALGCIKDLEVSKILNEKYLDPMEVSLLRWDKDLRMLSCERMLDPTRPVLITQSSISRDLDVTLCRETIENFLSGTSIRYFSQSFGRAIYELRSEFPSHLEPLSAKKMALGGLIYPARMNVDPVATDTYKLHTDWGNFYNGVAAALKVASSDEVQLTSEWMMSPQVDDRAEPCAAAGMILGFGLNGHLKDLNMYYAHEMLFSFDRMKSIALLIGLSASKMGSCDAQIFKVLATHLPFLMGPTSLDIKMDMTIQTAAVSALGLLFAGSGDTSLAKSLVNEIGRSLGTEESPVSDRSAYKLSCGFALGLIMLGKGNGTNSQSIAQLHQPVPPLSERLMTMMRGGLRDRCVFLPNLSINRIGQDANEPIIHTNHVKEAGLVNTHLSSKPAIIALGLMFMKTRNKDIAKHLRLPETITQLEKIRPDFAFVRILSFYLIMWDDIKFTTEWVEDQVPKQVRRYLTPLLDMSESYTNEIQWQCDMHVYECVDKETLSQIYLFSISAACYMVALKSMNMVHSYADRERIMYMLERYTSIVCPETPLKRSAFATLCELATPVVVTVCSSILVQAMALMRSGTGDLQTMRYCRLLRSSESPEKWATSNRKHYEQLASHMSLGMLFMGCGRYAFKNDDLSLATIVISTLPTLSHNVADNKHYHQPLRFLWALAAEPRLLIPVRSSDMQCIKVKVVLMVETETNKEEWMNLDAPCLLPPLNTIRTILVGSGEYEQRRFNLVLREEIEQFRKMMTVGQGHIKLKHYLAPINRNDEFGEFKPMYLEKFYFQKEPFFPKDLEKFEKMLSRKPDFRMKKGTLYVDLQNQLDEYYEILNKMDDENPESRELAINLQYTKLLHIVVNQWEGEIELTESVEEATEKLKQLAIDVATKTGLA